MFSLPALPIEQRRAALGAMRSVAQANGTFDVAEQALLSACARALALDESFAEVCAPAEVAAVLDDPTLRERLVQALMITAMMDGEVTRDEVAAVQRYAQALGVTEDRLNALRDIADGHVRMAWLRLARRSFARETFREALHAEGLGGVWRMVGPMIGLATDWDMARRYNALGELPAGTLGRAYWEFVTANHFGFPGEPNAVPERGVWHDLTHVLSGYPATDDGEVQNVCFVAGYRRDDPFFWVFTITMQSHMGLKMSPYSPRGRGHFDPEKVLVALHRGGAVRCDLSRAWDWHPDLARPLDDVRRDLNVLSVEEARASFGG